LAQAQADATAAAAAAVAADATATAAAAAASDALNAAANKTPVSAETQAEVDALLAEK
jgi:hypothetical protein